jgi:hypothetical protein
MPTFRRRNPVRQCRTQPVCSARPPPTRGRHRSRRVADVVRTTHGRRRRRNREFVQVVPVNNPPCKSDHRRHPPVNNNPLRSSECEPVGRRGQARVPAHDHRASVRVLAAACRANSSSGRWRPGGRGRPGARPSEEEGHNWPRGVFAWSGDATMGRERTRAPPLSQPAVSCLSS